MFGGKPIIGLDIGSSSVKAVQLRKTGKTIELEKFGIAEVHPNGDKQAVMGDPIRAKVDAVRRALIAGKFQARQAVSSVGGEPVLVRYIQMVAMPEAELRNALRWEAEGYIPYDIEEVNLDSVILGPAPDNAEKLDVLLVAVKKDLIERHLSIIKQADLTCSTVDVDSFAFLNQFEYNYQPGANDVLALVNVGAETTSVSIMRGGVCRFSREFSIAGDSITTSIQNKLNIPFLQAEQMKITLGAPMASEENANAMSSNPMPGGGGNDLLERIRGTVERITGEDLGDDSPESIARKAIKNTLNNLASELRRTIQFYENQTNGPSVTKLALGGGTARLKNLDAFLKKELRLDVMVADPLSRIRPRSSKDLDLAQLGENKALLSVAIGLALRNHLD